MTGVGMCGRFIPDRVQASQSGANRKVSNRLGVGGATTCCGGGRYIRRDRSGPCIDSLAISFPLGCVAVVSRPC